MFPEPTQYNLTLVSWSGRFRDWRPHLQFEEVIACKGATILYWWSESLGSSWSTTYFTNTTAPTALENIFQILTRWRWATGIRTEWSAQNLCLSPSVIFYRKIRLTSSERFFDSINYRCLLFKNGDKRLNVSQKAPVTKRLIVQQVVLIWSIV